MVAEVASVAGSNSVRFLSSGVELANVLNVESATSFVESRKEQLQLGWPARHCCLGQKVLLAI